MGREGSHVLFAQASALYADGSQGVYNSDNVVLHAFREDYDASGTYAELWVAQAVGFYTDLKKSGEDHPRVEVSSP